jgi:hypothetical protein
MLESLLILIALALLFMPYDKPVDPKTKDLTKAEFDELLNMPMEEFVKRINGKSRN